MTERNTTLNDGTEISQEDSHLIATVNSRVIDSLERETHIDEENFLNHWYNISPVNGGEANISTTLSHTESTLADIKQNYLSLSIDDYVSSVDSIILSALKLLYYVEQGKEWLLPINPLNMIYDRQSTITRAFYRFPNLLDNVNDDWVNEAQKLIVYLLIPEVEHSTEDFSHLDYASLYEKYLYSENASDELYKLTTTYGKETITELAMKAYDYIIGDEGEPNSVEDILRRIDGGGYVIQDVQESEETFAELEEKPVRNAGRKNSARDNRNSNRNSPNKNDRRQSKKKGGFGSFMLKLLIVGALVGGGYFAYKTFFAKPKTDNTEDVVKQKPVKHSPKDDDNFYKGVVAANTDQNKAAKYFDEFFNNNGDKESLSNDELATVFGTYLDTKQYSKIVKNIANDSTIKALIKFLLDKNLTEEIKNLPDADAYPLIAFAQADLENNYKGMIEVANDIDISDNQKYQNDLAKAFAETGNLEDGKSWAESQEDSEKLINAIKSYAYAKPGADKNDVNKKLGL